MFIKTGFVILLLSSVCFAQPKSIHWSALGNYLVDENGQRTTIQGHPWMVCYEKEYKIHGGFIKAEGATIWLRIPKLTMFMLDTIHKINKPVCDIIK